MFKITIALGATQWALLFKTKEAADKARNDLRTYGTGSLLIQDDFGQELALYPNSLSGWLYESLEESKLAYCELGMHQARTGIMMEKMAASDMTIRAARMTHGAAVMDPMMAFSPPNGRIGRG